MRRQLARVGIRSRLIVLVAFPALAVLVLGITLSLAARGDAVQAVQAQRDARTVVLLGRMHSLVVIEQGMAEGLLQLVDSGFQVTTLAVLYGFDLDAGRAAVDDSITQTAAELDELVGLDTDLTLFLQARSSVVARSLSGQSTVAEIRSLYEPMAARLADQRESLETRSLTQIPVGSAAGESFARSLVAADELAAWIGSSAELARLLSVTVRMDQAGASVDDEVLLQVGAAWRTERDSLARAQRDAGPSLAAELAASAGGRERYEPVLEDALVLSGLLVGEHPTDLVHRLDTLAAMGRFVFAWLDGTGAFYAAAVADVERSADAVVAEAQHDAAVTTGFTVAVLGACVLGALTVSWSILAPLARVARRASEVRDGDLHGERLGGGGPREIVAIGDTIEEMAANLELLEAQSEALGAGRLHDPVLHSTVPGRLGSSFQGSIERLAEVTERLAEQARVDPMTGLPNRAAALDHLQRLLAEHVAVAVLFIDLDGFKAVNDSFGHAAGDTVLVEIGRRLRLLMSGEGEVARLGGDEFLLLLPGADDAAAAAAGAMVIDAVSRAVVDGDHRYSVAASVGVAIGAAGDAHDLIRDADQATYRAKELGKGRVQFFDVELRRTMEEKALLQRQIRQAIDEGQFELYVQPVFRLDPQPPERGGGADGSHCVRISGGEALVRWNRPDVGLVLPGQFIPVAEESWLIVELGQFMLRRACSLLTRWQAAGHELHLSVNVSGRHVVDGAFVRDVRAILDATGADPSGLILEITESHLLTDLDTAAAALGQLRALGVRVALDDFGTGYASLSYLRQLPIDVMKIDRAYVTDIITDASQAPILENLLRLGEILGLSVVAEGVETAAQLESLRSMGCTHVQGFLLARPMTVDAFESFADLGNLAGAAPAQTPSP